MKLTYELELTPANADKIDQINRILLGESYTQSAPADTVITMSEIRANAAQESIITLDAFKEAAKAAKDRHGDAFALSVLSDHGVAVKSTLGRSLSAVDPDQYAEIMEAWAQEPEPEPEPEPKQEPEPEPDDWDDETEETSARVDPEAVKTALKVYAQSHSRDAAKAIMNKHGADVLSKVDSLSQKKLSAMLSELV